MTILGSCHCGAVKFQFKDQPESATECNCSLCRRLATLWIYSSAENIIINAPQGGFVSYTHGDKNLAINSCITCGCTTHWEDVKGVAAGKMAVNLRLADPAIVADIPVRRFDGADTWTFLD